MAEGSFRHFLAALSNRLAGQECAALADAELLARFVEDRDAAALEVLLWRHGPMVFALARRMTNCVADAEDVFQDTFLTFVRKAASIRRGAALGSWLFKTACRLATRRRACAERGPQLLSPAADVPDPVPVSPETEEQRVALYEEIERLPARLRDVVVLCCLEGATGSAAARELGCPKGTIDSRLHAARQRLRARLERRGITLTPLAVALLLAQAGRAASPPPKLVNATLAPLLAGDGLAANSFTRGGLAVLPIRSKVAALLAVIVPLFVGGLCLRSIVAGPDTPDPTHAAKETAPRPRRGDHPLVGAWQVVRARKDGEADRWLTPEYHFLFSRTAFYRQFGEEMHDPSHDVVVTPRTGEEGWIDFTEAPPDPTRPLGPTTRAIYRRRGDDLTICWNLDPAGERPRAFSAERGSGHRLVVLRRSDRHHIEGVWELVQEERDGLALPAEKAKELRLEFQGATVKQQGAENREGYFSLTQHHSPRQIELELDRPGPGKERVWEKFRGVYHLTGAVLEVCIGPEDNPPRDFTTARDTGQRRLVLRRVKPEGEK
jgi:RNA polymerase sigma factor (sigma-70 family)